MPASMDELLDLLGVAAGRRASPKSTRAPTPAVTRRRGGSRLACPCPRPRRSSRATSSRPREADRQPLPSRFSRLRRGTRRRRRTRAQAAGVERMVTISTRVGHGDRLVAIAEKFPNVYFTIGTHPHQAAEEPRGRRGGDPRASPRIAKCVGIGEAGLDYHYNYAPPDVAARVFRAQIGLARELGLPLVIHAREADDDIARILREEMAAGGFKAAAALLHVVARAGRDRARTRALRLVLRRADLQEFRRAARDRARRSARPAAGRDRRAVPRAGSRIAASATSPPSSSTPPGRSPRSRASTSKRSPPRRAPTR